MELPQWEQLIPHYSLTFPNPIRLDNLSAQTKAKFYRAYLGDVDFLLKELQYENNKNDFDAVVREKIETLRNLSHSNMTKYFGLAMRQVAVNSLILYRISTEYHTGGDLSQWVQRRLADPNQQTKATLFTPHAIIQKFLRDLLAGLCYIHSFGIIHCDIKPENILLRQRKRHSLVIVDFEGSAMNGERQGRVQSVDFTARYAAPELMLCAAMLGNDCASAERIQ
ncbi:serine/threonine-protein kinase Chk1-like isoform X2 [Paramacrobiotus metropolitanus]|uniref:serine/threonine-protein kinase Chk1-like isoform X2 n=1 Tax=Paramacrobiotus metropolitanus TaxID=2943436 RepID=UPI0024464F53|nr:serine/threonine-protein kinase Chk1-like isoform X2 [Paramacrobiotus metropolitanus]